ncbi:MAG: DNA primase [Rhizobiaceae bacterium]|nr:DNA primase [Hyphomicrobiales bacterium]NRB31194.1 DNA primase [Rhizobiaceae bacterium]
MRFPPSFLEDIKDRIPIADVVGRRVTFDRKKSNPSKGDFWACCPFHGEKTPSFHCENQKGRYHCFGCGASGDHFRFMTELDGLSFPEAVERLADEAGVPMPAVDPKAMEREQKKASLYDVMQLAVDFFRDQLQTSEGAKARAYLRDRRLSPAVQNDFQLGYAPSSRNALKEYLASKGVDQKRIEACGLVVFGPEIPVSYDRFRDRIMFPILDARSRPIAFGGRALSADVPAKYLNSPETELFSKSNVLYNYAKARKAVERGGSLIVCEGYMDVIALHAAGFETGVAPLGTALTEPQIELAWRVGGEPTLCFDGDEAGLRAAFRSIDTALSGLKPGRSLRFSLLPEGEDPDDLIGRAGPEAFQQVLDSARPLADMLWRRETDGRIFDTPEKRAELERTVFGVLSQIAEENVKRHYQQDMRDRLASFFGQVDNNRRGQGGQAGGAARQGSSKQRFAVSESLMNSPLVKSGLGAPALRECVLLGTVVNHPAIGLAHFDQFAALDIEHPDLKKVHRALLNVFAEAGERGEQPSLDDVKASVEAQGFGGEMSLLDSQIRNNRIWQCLPEAAFEDAAEGWVQALSLYERNRGLKQELRAAERAYNEIGDEASFYRMTHVRDEISREEGMEALIEGFGLASGRAARSF